MSIDREIVVFLLVGLFLDLSASNHDAGVNGLRWLKEQNEVRIRVLGALFPAVQAETRQ